MSIVGSLMPYPQKRLNNHIFKMMLKEGGSASGAALLCFPLFERIQSV